MIGKNVWIVSVDGEQGCGKTTFIEDIKKGKYNEELNGFELHFLKETNSDYAKEILDIAKTMNETTNKYGSSQLTWLFAFSILRKEITKQIDKIVEIASKNENKKHLIVIDRYWLTTAIYQSVQVVDNRNPFLNLGKNIEKSDILKVQFDLFRDYIPDFQIVISIPFEVAQSNRQKRSKDKYINWLKERFGEDWESKYNKEDELREWRLDYNVNWWTEFVNKNIPLPTINYLFKEYVEKNEYKKIIWKEIDNYFVPIDILVSSDKNITNQEFKWALEELVDYTKE